MSCPCRGGLLAGGGPACGDRADPSGAQGDVLLTTAAEAGAYYRIDTSADLQAWQGFVTVRSTGSEQVLDSGSSWRGRRYYRAVPLTGSSLFTGDHLATTSGDAVMRAIGHASVAVSWNDFSGDTEDIPEMRALTGIDAAFVCMSLPSNMTVDKAADAVRAFRAGMVFPYHYSQGGTVFDTVRFKTLVGNDLEIEVRQRTFY